MKKSKFLKKSLAMLLALMLVVAMIPLSASAALPDDLKYINVNDDQVSVSALEVDMSSSYLDDDSAVVEIDTNDDLGDVELRVYEKGGSVEYKVAPQTPATDNATNDFLIKDFVDVSADEKTGTMKLALIDTKNTGTGADDKEPLAEYTLTINFVDSNITTNLDVVADINGSFGAGIYDAEVKGDEIVVKMARHNNDADTKWDETVQATVAPVLTVKGLDGATIYAVDGVTVTGNPVQYKITDADNGTVITVRSQDGKHDSDYTVVAEYVDALSSFSAEVAEDTVVDATITNEVEKNDNVPDTITLTVPKSVLVDENGDTDVSPELPISYAVNGNVNARDKAKVEVKIGNNAPVTVKNDGSVSVEMTGLGNKNAEGDYAIPGTVTVTRFGSFVQEYNLVVKLEDSANTTIEYARVDATVATVDGEAGTITAVLPQNFNGNETKRESVELVLYTENTVTDVVLSSGTETTPSTSENLEPGQKAWKFTGVDTLTTNATISVYAEDGHFEQYTLSTSMAQATNSASMTAFWLKNGSTTYEGVKTGDKEFTISVPYMTTNTEGWKVYATAGTNAKVVYNGSTQVDIINGVTTTNQIGLANAKLPLTGISTEVVAVNTADDDIFNAYTVKIVLAEKKSAKVLTGLDFTSQVTTNNTDKLVVRTLNDENQFHAYVNQLSDGTPNLDNINLYVPGSLSTHTEDYYTTPTITYHNIVTGFVVPEGAVAYTVKSTPDSGTYLIEPLKATTDALDQPVSGTSIDNDSTIIVLPEEIARQVETGTAGVAYPYANFPGRISKSAAAQYGTVYDVNVKIKDYETDSTLETIQIGDVPLKVEGHMITGELPWSYTIPSSAVGTKNVSDNSYPLDSDYVNYAKFATFTVSDYAALRAAWGGTFLAINDNGNDATSATTNNEAFVFVRNDDMSVTVMRYNGSALWDLGDNVSNQGKNKITVRAEDRLALKDNSSYKVSQTEYTFDLTWKAPSNEAEISNFTVAGRTGTVTNTSETERTITVQVPYGTDLKGMIATFEHSLGSTVKIGSPSGLDFISGTTSLNYTSDVIVYVTSEDGKVQNRYTITVEEGLSFSDVNPGDWFYDNVMDAAENGYVSGMGDGTFQPKKATTRAQFASMIANALGYESDPDAASMFPDVAEDYWGKSAINFCVKNDILKGYDDGTFQPNKAITRQEAASILRNAFKLTESSSETFPDDSAISGWAKESVYIVKASGLMKGDAGTGNFRPTDTIIRAEAASILMNAKYAGLIK
ncbi:MAG: S-layer homology domain-containing protein [Acutalibacter sp.]